MERRQRPPFNGTWERPRYGNSLAPRPPRFGHEPQQRPPPFAGPQAHPRVLFPDGGAQQRPGPWESDLHYEAGPPDGAPHEGAEQRDFIQHGYQEPQQHGGAQLRPPRPEVFRHGGTRPGMPHHAPVQPVRARGMLPQPSAPHYNMQRAGDLYGPLTSEALQSPSMRNDGPVPNIPPQRTPEPQQGVTQYSAPGDGAQQAPDVSFQGRPQPVIRANSQENASEPRSQDVSQRLIRHDNVYQSGERHYRGPQPMIPANSQETASEPRSQDIGQRLNRHDDVYQSGERHYRGPQPMISASSQETASEPRSQDIGQRLNRHDDVYQLGERHYNVQPHRGPQSMIPASSQENASEPRSQDVSQRLNRHDDMYQSEERRYNVQPHRGPQTMIPASPQETVSEPRSQDVSQRLNRHDDMYQSGEQHYRGPQPMIPASSQETMSEPRSQDFSQRLNRHDDVYQSGERHYRGPQPMIPANSQETASEPRSQDIGQQLNRHNDMYQSGERRYNVQPHRGPQPMIPANLQETASEPRSQDIGQQLNRHDDVYQSGERHYREPQPMIPANLQENVSEPRSQDVSQRLNCHDDVYQSGERHYRGPQPMIPASSQENASEPRSQDVGQRLNRHDDMYQSGERHYRGPQPMFNASSQENASEPRSQDVSQRLNRHDDVYQSGDRHYRGPQPIPDEHQDHVYSERSERPDAYQPDVLHRGGPRGPDPLLSQYSSTHPSGRPPACFQHDLPPSIHLYKDEGAQPDIYRGGSQTGFYNVNTPPVPNTLNYRAPSPGIPQYSPHMQPAQNPPPQANYPVPPVHGNLPNPPYALHPPVASGFSASLEEGDLEVPRLQRHQSHPNYLLNPQQIMFQDRRQGLDPIMPSGIAGGRHFEHGATFHQHEVPDGLRAPDLLPQHGSPFVSQHMKDNFMHSERQTDIEGGPADKEVFTQWLSSFLSRRRKKPPSKPDTDEAYSIAEARELIYGALRLVSQLDSLCQTMESSDKAGKPWTCDYEKADDIRVDIEKRLNELEKPGYLRGVKRKLDRVRKKRLRSQRRREATEEEKQAAERSAEKEASIDLWRIKRIQEVEEKKLERELKATADSVLGEVRKKQNDVKKMLDVLKSLEKLRKLRKEAAGRKGVCPPPSADETFTNHIKRLRTMVHKRSALYDAEEKTLRVILEGEQEEERQRENEKRVKKEKEKLLQKQRELDSILFGDTESLPSLHPLQPFRQYYLQAEHSVVSLVQIRHEWDQFLVPQDHPDGCSIPRGWVVPTPPSNDSWATALKQSD